MPGSGSGIFKSLDPDPEFSNDLDPDPEKYFERPGSRSKIIAPKSYLSNNTSKILKLLLGRIQIRIRIRIFEEPGSGSGFCSQPGSESGPVIAGSDPDPAKSTRIRNPGGKNEE